jgi:transposase
MPIPLRADFDAQTVRAAAKRSTDGAQARRHLALAAIYEGATRTEAAKIGGVTPQIVRDWVLKFNAHGPDGLIDCKPPGQPPRLNDTHRAALDRDKSEQGGLALDGYTVQKVEVVRVGSRVAQQDGRQCFLIRKNSCLSFSL